jgi:hypothetical protein
MWWNLKNFRPEPLLGYVPMFSDVCQAETKAQ